MGDPRFVKTTKGGVGGVFVICCFAAWSAYCLVITWSAICLSVSCWSAICLYASTVPCACLVCYLLAYCLNNRLLQIAYAARSQVGSYHYIGAGNNALYAAAGALLRGCFLHKRIFAYLLGKFRVCFLLSM